MKKLLLIALCVVACSLIAAEAKYESLAGAEEAITALNGVANWKSVQAKACKTYFEAEDMSYADFKTLIKETCIAEGVTSSEASINDFIIDIGTMLDNGVFIDDIIADTSLHTNGRFVTKYKLGLENKEKIQAYSATIKDKDELYKEYALTYNNPYMAGLVVDKYIKDNIMNKDTTVLEVFYAAYYDKITMDAWKPIVTKIALNLKRRGVEVQ